MQKIINALRNGVIERDYAGLIHVKPHSSEPLVILNYTDACARGRRWDEVTRACRGLIVNPKTGEVAALPFPKFFNIGEWQIPEVALEELPEEPFTVFEKADGSLGIHYRTTDGQLHLATRGSFTSDQAIRGTQMLRALPGVNAIPDHLTLLFEIVYPENRVVVDYGETEELVLLGAYDRFTGTELPWDQVEELAQVLGVRTPQVFQFGSIAELLEAKATLPADLEGYVIRFEGDLRVKLKGDAYLELHKAALNISERQILAALVEECYEQYLQQTPEEFAGQVEDIADAYRANARAYEQAVRALFAEAPTDGERKAFALWVQENAEREYHPALFQLINGREPEWLKLANK